MRTWQYWQHWDCEVNIWHYATEQECWDNLASWLDECDEDCDHTEVVVVDHQTVREAIEWHYEELSWGIDLIEVPQAQVQLTAERVTRPTEENRMPVAQADELMSRLQTFQGSS